MAREKFQTLTEPMFYILLGLRRERCGADIAAEVRALTQERVCIGPGTLYNLLDRFFQAEMIRETKAEGRRRSYLITSKGQDALDEEYRRLLRLAEDYRTCKEGLQ